MLLPLPLIGLVLIGNSNMFRKYPTLNKPGNGTLFLLVYSARFDTVDQGLCQWASSAEGKEWCRETVVDVRRRQPREQLILSVSALYSYAELLYDRISDPVNDFSLRSLDSLFFGHKSKDQSQIFRGMALSIADAVGKNDPAVLSFLVLRERARVDVEGESAKYWSYRIKFGLGHVGARIAGMLARAWDKSLAALHLVL